MVSEHKKCLKEISHYMQKVMDEAEIRTHIIIVKGESATECATHTSNHRIITFIVYFIYLLSSDIIKKAME